MSVVLMIVGLLMFVGLVVVHEFGHFIVARRNGIDVQEFGLGFPPRAKVLARKKGTVYSLNWLPLGGFVRLKGEHDADTSPHSFGAASLWAKVKVMVAGVFMNLATAFVLLTLLALVGLPKLLDNQFTVASDTRTARNDVLVGFVEDGSPAQKAGLQQRDQLVSIGLPGQTPIAIKAADQLPGVTKQFAGQTVDVTIKHNDHQTTKAVTLRTAAQAANQGYLGISPTEYTLRRSTWSAPVTALGLMGQFTAVTLQGLGNSVINLFQGNFSQAGAQVTGPVGIFYILKDGSFLGYQFIVLLMAVISLTLGIINLLPIPALDGGRLFLILWYRLIRRPLAPEREELVNAIGFLMLMVLIAVVTVLDFRRPH